MLTGIDDVPWAALEIPGLLRSAASKDADVADQAREGLDESLFYLGSVFPATAAAVPFLAALARGARHGRAELLWLLGAVADPAHGDGDALPAIRRALATQLPIPVTLLTDKASAVREAAAYAAARAGVTAGPLLDRWRAERTATVRASLALALGEVDPGGALERAAAKGPAKVRLAAAMALLRAGQPLPDRVVTALVTAIGAGAQIAGYWVRDGDWFRELAAPAGPAPSSDRAGSDPPTSPAADSPARSAADSPTRQATASPARQETASPPRPGADSSARSEATDSPSGPATAPSTDQEAASSTGQEAASSTDQEAASSARQVRADGMRAGSGLLETLVRTGSSEALKVAVWAASTRCAESRAAPARMVPLFAAAAADPQVRPDAIRALWEAGVAAGRYADLLAEAAAGLPAAAGGVHATERSAANALGRLGDPRWVDPVSAATAAGMSRWMLLDCPRRTPEALAAVRSRLAAEPSRPGILPSVLGEWRAAEAVPELLAVPPHQGVSVSLALLHIGYDHPAIAEHLAPRVARRNPEAALAVLRITGDAEPLRELVRRVLTGEEQLQWRSLEVPGEAVRDLLPLAPAQLTSVDPEIRILAARVVAALDGWAASFPTVRDVLAAGGVAARAAAEMVTEPLLRAKSADPHCQLEAIRALARLGVPVGEMTEALMAAFGHRLGETALAAIRELRAVGTIPALEELAASDRRIPLFHVVGRYVWDDEREVEEIRATIADLS